MTRIGAFALLGAILVLSGGLVGQEPKKVDKPKDETAVKGRLPANWSKLDLSDSQRTQIYKVQSKYSAEIKKLKDQIEELEATRMKEMRAVLSPEQRKKLDQIVLGKDE
jgi:Spy/CpxP family protein refolding chaperone